MTRSDRALIEDHLARLADLSESYRQAGPAYDLPRSRVDRLARLIGERFGLSAAEAADEQPSLLPEVA